MTINFFNGDSVTLVILIILVSLPIFRSEVTRDELQRNREKRLCEPQFNANCCYVKFIHVRFSYVFQLMCFKL